MGSSRVGALIFLLVASFGSGGRSAGSCEGRFDPVSLGSTPWAAIPVSDHDAAIERAERHDLLELLRHGSVLSIDVIFRGSKESLVTATTDEGRSRFHVQFDEELLLAAQAAKVPFFFQPACHNGFWSVLLRTWVPVLSTIATLSLAYHLRRVTR